MTQRYHGGVEWLDLLRQERESPRDTAEREEQVPFPPVAPHYEYGCGSNVVPAEQTQRVHLT